ncbi:MAG: thiamine pyrophosphate-dependent enzyme [Pseudomonadota bacterium]|nr:thiamine pyrophosphate-dependent enzyme [Pseudomonadota bacterium]
MTARSSQFELRRRDIARRIVERHPDALYVTGLGATTWDLAASGRDVISFPLWGAMGGAAAMGLGLALAQPDRRVIVITGDGEQLMGLGALATIGHQAPANLAVVVFDNESYGETGMQPTHTAGPTDLAMMADGAGFPLVLKATDDPSFSAILPVLGEEAGPVFAQIKIRAEVLPFALPEKDGAVMKDRFRAALGVADV